MNRFQGKCIFYLAWNVRWCVRSGSIFCSAFSCPFPGTTCISFNPRLLFSKCMIIGSGRWLLTMKRGLKTIYKKEKKKTQHFYSYLISELHLLKQAINKSFQWVILPLINHMTCKLSTLTLKRHYLLFAAALESWALKSGLCTTHT